MELRYLCDGEYRYDPPPTVVRPYGGQEAIAFGGGAGRFSGERLSGEISWSNFPRIRDDGIALPNLTGKVQTEGGAVLLFETRGVSAPTEGTSGNRICSAVRFHTEAESHRWLNEVLVVEEGHIDTSAMAVFTRLWVCAPEISG